MCGVSYWQPTRDLSRALLGLQTEDKPGCASPVDNLLCCVTCGVNADDGQSLVHVEYTDNVTERLVGTKYLGRQTPGRPSDDQCLS
jgi:hypothetical protein